MTKVAIMLPVFNADETLQRCISSLTAQTFQDFVVVAMDDNSTDTSLNVLKNNESNKMVISTNDKNHGCVSNRNRILRRIFLDYPEVGYVAVQDADDWSEPERLEKQVAFLDRNKEYGLCGTWYYWHDIVNGSEHTRQLQVSTEDEDIRSQQYFGSQACHGSYVVRREVYRDVGIYDDYFQWSHDNDWLTRVLYHKKWKVCSLPDFLYHVWVTPYTHSKTEERNIYKQKQRYKRYCESVGVEFNEKNWRRLF